jgi:hypothetical protein
VSQVVLKDGSIEKTVRLRALCKLEWFENGQSAIVMPVSTKFVPEMIWMNKLFCIAMHNFNIYTLLI